MSKEKRQPLRQIILSDDEQLVKGLHRPYWMDSIKRGSASIFEKNDTSVTRSKRVGFPESVKLVKSDVERSKKFELIAVGTIGVAELKKIGSTLADQKDPPPAVHYRVFEEPTDYNEEHAEVVPYADAGCSVLMGRVTTGLSRRIRDRLHNYLLDSSGAIIEENPPANSQ
ncbi:hypothetical protein RBU55_06490 [Pseudomonas chlororaphis subsp. aurantiaca]|uniref:hypothetical protein n=1 Tax=Pseudomonas chlororaphis TaxID=587753 RepID=UPI0027DDB04A|nr:hypothetical protein [Pseudomonas chlororaphis]WMJ01197.1 hypothetical protein RBU55_06490 [Pseudomonas chlororaphis subsp. aurantiaca]